MIRSLWYRPWLWPPLFKLWREARRANEMVEEQARAEFFGCSHRKCDRIVRGSEGASQYRAFTLCPRTGCTNLVSKHWTRPS